MQLLPGTGTASHASDVQCMRLRTALSLSIDPLSGRTSFRH